MVLFFLAWVQARAAEPGAWQCQAVWVGPKEACGLAGSWLGNGAGKTENAARKDALASLVDTVDSAARAAADRTAGTLAAAVSAPQIATCPKEAQEAATVTCIAAAGLVPYQMCFVDLPERVCDYTDQFTIEAFGYRAFELGRKRMCQQLEAFVRTTETSVAEIEACHAACNQATRVRCPGLPATQ
jgi:hypothetical protein